MTRMLATASLLCCAACAPAQPAANVAAQHRSPVETLFPLIDGNIYTYQSTSATGEKNMFMVRVKRTGPTSANLHDGANTRSLQHSADFVRREGGGFVLRAPIQVGTTWNGDKGTVRIESIDATVTVPAGTFSKCVKTVEESSAAGTRRVFTWFCPDVGIAQMQVEQSVGADQATERVELKSFGPPMTDIR